VRYEFIKNHKEEFPVVKMCNVLKVSSSGYYGWLNRKPSGRVLFRQYVLENIQTVYEQSKCRYGSPRISKELHKIGVKVSEKSVARLMRLHNIRSIIVKKYKTTTDSKHPYPIVENKLMQNFLVERKNQVWVSDITYINTLEGWLYLTTVIDLFDRKVVGWSLSHTMKAKDTSVNAFKMALQHSPLKENVPLIFHSDRGVQYACDEFKDELSKHKNITRSMSRKGNCWDNAVAESFFKTLKTELIYHQKYQTRYQAELAIFEYIEGFYNTTRRHQHLNNLNINEYHQQLIKTNAA
jgi:putative transposase